MYKDGVNPGVVDVEEFAEIPPSKCKKGGATFRTGCGDDGYPIRDKKKVSNLCLQIYDYEITKKPNLVGKSRHFGKRPMESQNQGTSS